MDAAIQKREKSSLMFIRKISTSHISHFFTPKKSRDCETFPTFSFKISSKISKFWHLELDLDKMLSDWL